MKSIKGKNGFVSIEVILFGSFILLIFLSIISFFTYAYPTFTLQRDVDTLVRTAQMNGGLRTSDVTDFVDRVNKYNFTDKEREVTIDGATSPSNYTIIGVNSYNYIKRGSGEVMEIVVKIPHKNKFINPFGGAGKLSDEYTLIGRTLSERP